VSTRPRRRRLQIRLSWLMLVALLFQQVAVAAHACDVLPAATGDYAALEPHPCEPAPQPADDALCAKHCSPDRAASAEPIPAKAPLWLAAAPTLSLVALQPLPACCAQATGLADAGPPPTLRYTRLLI
jgi:hypothetical protein